MKVRVQPDLCCGAQRCAVVAPDVYRLVDGFNALVNEPGDHLIPEGLVDQARKGAAACPESAIKITD